MTEKNIILYHIEVTMRLLKIPILCLLFALFWNQSVKAQSCADLTPSPKESMRILDFRGSPGDTVLMPFSLDNDSAVTAFRFFIRFDTSKLDLVEILDINPISGDTTYFLDMIPAGRLASALNSSDFSGVYLTNDTTPVNPNTDNRRLNSISVTLLPPLPVDDPPKFADTLAADAAGSVIFYIKFIAKPTLVHLRDTARFFLLREDICIVDTSSGLPIRTCFGGCNAGQLNEVWTPLGVTEPIDNLVFPSQFTGLMRFITDTTPPKPTIVLSASKSTVAPGEFFNLNWTVTNGDSLQLYKDGVYILSSTTLTSSLPTSLVATSTFKLKAWKGVQSDSASKTITVSGTPPPVSVPTISFSPVGPAYVTTEGQAVSFTVTATGQAANGNITLRASNIPQNGAFAPTNPILGPSPVSGIFSFTPNIGQVGTFVVNFSAVNSGGTTNTAATIQVSALPVDKLFSTSAANQKPVGGLRGAKGVMFPINLITNKTVYGIQFNLRHPLDVVTLDSFVVTGRIPDYVVYDNIGNTPGRVKVLSFGLNNEPVVSDTSTAILYAVFSIDSSAIPWQRYPIHLDSAFESIDPNPNVASDTLKTDSGIIDIDNPGDVNLDRRINVADVVNIVAYIIGNFGLTPRQFSTADIITNDSVNVFDLVGDINFIYGSPISPSPSIPEPGPDAVVSLAYDNIPYGTTEMMTIKTELHHKIAGVQLEVAYDPAAVTVGQPKISTDADNFVLQYKDDGRGSLRMILYTLDRSSSESGLLQPGFADLVEIPITAKDDIQSGDKSVLRLSQALLSTGTATSVGVQGVDAPLPVSFLLKQNYPNPFNPTTTIEFTVPRSSGGTKTQKVSLEIFNVLGQQVNTLLNEELQPGEHQVEWNATSSDGARVATGIYLYRLRIGEVSQTKKMLLLK